MHHIYDFHFNGLTKKNLFDSFNISDEYLFCGSFFRTFSSCHNKIFMGRRMNTNPIKECKELIANIELILHSYGIKKEYIIRETKISKTQFYQKLANKSFTLEDLEKIADVVNR